MPLDLSEIRQQITQIDRNLLKLLSERHQLAYDVVRSKELTQTPLRDLEREREVLKELILFAENESYPLDPLYITQIFQKIMEDSVLTQQNYLQSKINKTKQSTITVAFLGMRGSYSHLATRQFAKQHKETLIELSCNSFNDVLERVKSGEADYGILPLENTTSGSINDVYDLLQHTDLSLVGELVYTINHCILGITPVDLGKIETLYSHPQVIQQCSQFIQRLNKVHIKYCESSSHAMKLVASLNNPNIVALGNQEGGRIYGLEVLKQDIANQKNNITRFVVFAKEPIEVSPQIETKTLLLMNTTQQAGALVDALMVFKKHNIVMTKLESRPIYGKPWEEMFYIELRANIHNKATQEALEELKEFTRYINVLGCYPSEVIEPTKVG
ncbi:MULTISPECIES: chorismate mutase [Pasteurellaceae]|uniref:Bifunctional chorismate mutase/prephenate dehydratase n=1 Tax=Pasteurella atlantica TaxID=2827233 RepID=A0AAW8CQH2_9PAST|nr:chorismate mutase [Pasteurella atlantica]MBR0573743.1 chorismate mutase [Pasteurella atlantica]MDP8039622.1 chorismate mutase [Pasteurella atlantica]MDP8041713.1 chorismate mutase [Pasteurella atlantica]MDP8044013.1 chorismate mutase [Pasteurella atlantica]MDP8045991.1 chorismate mutase [Pasteurella atlantica]